LLINIDNVFDAKEVCIMLAPSIFEENFIDDLFGFPMKEFDDMERKLYGRKANRMMKTDIREKDDNYEVSVDLPGFKKEEITVELDNGYLTISAAKGLDKDENKKGKLIRQERYAGSMTRSFYIGDNVEKGDIEATYRHGVLTLTVPKKALEKRVPEKNLIAIEG
jgi:HSP20 family molecular chaperone IbpA